MKLKVLSTGSVGNCYILENENEALVIDAGVRFLDIKKAVNFDLGKMNGAIITHEHLDHSKSMQDLIKNGIQTFASQGTFEALQIGNMQGKGNILRHNEIKKIGRFSVIPFDVKHDCVEPLGFLINHPDTGNILFATDTKSIPYKFTDLRHILIEANYSEEILKQNFNYVNQRVVQSHFSFENCMNYLKSQDLTKVENIILIHLSDRNSDEQRFIQQGSETLNKPVKVANNQTEYNFNLIPF